MWVFQIFVRKADIPDELQLVFQSEVYANRQSAENTAHHKVNDFEGGMIFIH